MRSLTRPDRKEKYYDRKKLYTCDICHTDYADKDRAKECEKNHKLLEKATIIGEYKSIKSIANGIPTKIRVKFPNSDEWFDYKR